jgi:hypothetical protein
MRISEKRHAELYGAISNPIMSLRIKRQMGDTQDIDTALWELEQKIYAEIKDALYLSKS